MKLNRTAMSNFSAFTYLALVLSISSIISCNEDKATPEPLPEPVETQEPELISLEEALNEESPSEVISVPESETVHNLSSTNFTPNLKASGPFVLQVGTSTYQKDADAMVRKIKKLGYEAYTVEVSNPADLQGQFIRVRLGYFSNLSDARAFGHNVLIPANIPFWIDNRDNDRMMGTSQSTVYEEPKMTENTYETKTEAKPQPVEDEWGTPSTEVKEVKQPEKTEPKIVEETAKKVEPMVKEVTPAPEAVADDWSAPEKTSVPKVVKEMPKKAAETTNSWDAPAVEKKANDAWSDDEGWE